MKPALILVDASVYIFRAWFALPESISNPHGQPINAVTGFIGFLQSLHAQAATRMRAAHFAIAFDESLNSSFRNKLYPPYKANRETAPANLKWQMQQCRTAARAMGFATFASKRYEADDLIATIAARMRPMGFRMFIVSSDKDLAQIISGTDRMWNYAKEELLGVKEIEQKLGVHPRQVPDWLGLCGDAIDNIPGVPGIGNKTAVQLLSHFKDIDHLYHHLHRVPDLSLRGARSIHEKLARHEEQARLSRKLATTCNAIPIKCDKERLKKSKPRLRLVSKLVHDLGLSERAKERILNMN